MKRPDLLLVFLLWLVAGPVLALSGDEKQPIEVEADLLEVRDDDNISVYRGNVTLSQGSIRISSDQLTIYFNENDELELMEMTGSPARFRQLDDENLEMIGLAEQINYRETESVIILLGNASFTHDGDRIESDRIEINTENDNLSAGSDDPSKRVKMLIQPGKDN